jgi:hypothetical protein
MAKKKIPVFIALFFVLCMSTYAQKTEKIRFYSLLEERHFAFDKAVFVGYQQTYNTVSGAGTAYPKLLTYQSGSTTSDGGHTWTEWSAWELIETRPLAIYEDAAFLLTDISSGILETLRKEGSFGLLSQLVIRDKQATIARILTAPSGRSQPVWFDKHGNLCVYYAIYAIFD